ncbi:nitroreductase family protein [Nocardioides nematodiphilus]|uniref:nitroreductase family protein n=1 Tax=Nocardioides nematodiphilus TaxID=2849669 RepID=UPI001CD92C34|nr:nitroreductase family protein [Nocardioides nematodiphilus]MCA1983311.1 nitroreductase family protein [Nocardioides nematodiphilus]
MEFQDVVRTRRMVRRYRPDPVATEQVDRVLRNAVRAPNAGFSQGWSFLVLDTPEDVARYWDLFVGDEEWEADGWLRGMRTAPVLILPCSSKAAYLRRYAEGDKGWTDEDEARWPMPYWHMDTAMAVMLMLQTVVDEGLGACYFGIPPRHESEVRAAFGIPEEWDPIGVVSIGHPDTGGSQGSPSRRTRKPMEEVVHRGRW